jgi:hypothetical protein
MVAVGYPMAGKALSVVDMSIMNTKVRHSVARYGERTAPTIVKPRIF